MDKKFTTKFNNFIDNNFYRYLYSVRWYVYYRWAYG